MLDRYPIKLLDKGAGPFWNASATPRHRFRVLLEFGPKLACIELVSAIDVLFVLLVGAIVAVWEF